MSAVRRSPRPRVARRLRVPPGLIPWPAGTWHDTAVLVVEILSPDDETFAKLDFYRRHGVSELLVADWRSRTVRCLALQEEPQERDRSDVLAMSTAQIEAQVDWPPLGD